VYPVIIREIEGRRKRAQAAEWDKQAIKVEGGAHGSGISHIAPAATTHIDESEASRD
tara:strand:+ start:474 stop:644 length:171 start_codon:yes stop_codon:yes gene_type:complete